MVKMNKTYWQERSEQIILDLDENAKVPENQLPSTVTDTTDAELPEATTVKNRIFYLTDKNIYIISTGTIYKEITTTDYTKGS